jgi:hypothetical protein
MDFCEKRARRQQVARPLLCGHTKKEKGNILKCFSRLESMDSFILKQLAFHIAYSLFDIPFFFASSVITMSWFNSVPFIKLSNLYLGLENSLPETLT